MPTSLFTVARADLRNARFESKDTPALQPGEVRLKVDSFALTANNITYAAFGEAMRYWDFFPCEDSSRGCIPVWGFGEVLASRVDGITEGERFYGFLPMANQVTLRPVKVNEAGFMDGSSHREGLAAVYNHYTRCSTDPGYRADQEAQLALLRPCSPPPFLIDDFLGDAGILRRRRGGHVERVQQDRLGDGLLHVATAVDGPAPRLVGLTSASNLAYTTGLGLYDQVCTYDQVGLLPADQATVYVDYSGSTTLRSAVHHHFADQLRHSCAVGGTHWETLGAGSGLPGPRPILFFAPAQVKKRMAEWGPAGLAQRLAASWQAFMLPVNDPVAPWLSVVRGQGPDAVMKAYLDQLDGRVPAVEGLVLSL